MQINTNITSKTNYQVTNNKLKENDKLSSDQVILGSTEKDETLMMCKKLKDMKHSDGLTAGDIFEMVSEEAFYMAGGGVFCSILAATLGASGMGILGAFIGGSLLGGIGGLLTEDLALKELWQK
jgi:hypothetical protein